MPKFLLTAVGTLSLIAQIGGATLTLPTPLTALTTSDAVGQVLGPVTLSSGDNTIAFPTGKTTSAVIVIWPSGNAIAVGLGAGGAVHAAPTGWYPHIPRPTDTSLIINAASQLAGVYIAFI